MEAPNRFHPTRAVGASPVHPALRSTAQCIKRFDGHRRAATAWDSLRRDEELWYDKGNCTIHFCKRGSSKRGPSLKVPLESVEGSKSPYLLEQCLVRCDRTASPASEDNSSDSGYGSARSNDEDSVTDNGLVFIPAPTDLTRADTHNYHIGTRNFFAFLLGKPLVGETLGAALTDLWDRIQLWQPHTASTASLVLYCRKQGYLNFAENPAYAVAALQVSEQAGLPEVWMDALAHCVGMCSQPGGCLETSELSGVTSSLISYASLELYRRVAQASQALGEFMEDALGPEFLGLSKPARDHLDRFRSSLHSFYVEKHGYFPPDATERWAKPVWTGMYYDFQRLYEYLADVESSQNFSSNTNFHGGVCVIQNVQALNQRHGFLPLPHPLPLLPDTPARRRTVDSQINLRAFKLPRANSMKSLKQQDKQSDKLLMEQAANSCQQDVMANALVQEYVRFERLKLEEKISLAEARKIRWLLVYGMLQMLISVIRAPKEVQDVESPSYPLCLPTTGFPSWAEIQSQHTRTRPSTARLSVHPACDEDRISIHPDCEADSAEEYFSRGSLSRTNSDNSDSMAPAPLRIMPQMSRTASIRSSVHSSVNSLQRSVIDSLSRRNSGQRSVIPSLSRVNSTIGTVPETDGAEDDCEGADAQPSLCLTTEFSDDHMQPSPEPSIYETGNEPTLEAHQLDMLANPRPATPASPVGTFVSTYSQPQSGRNSASSSVLEFCDSPATAPSSVDEDEDGNCALLPTPSPATTASEFAAFDFDFDGCTPQPRQKSAPSGNDKKVAHIDAPLPAATPSNSSTGCEVPACAAGPVPSRVSSLRAFAPPPAAPVAHSLLGVPLALRSDSFSSVASDASSVYPDTSVQAAEIEEEDSRGRRRTRGLEHLPAAFGTVDARFFEGITELR